MDDDIAEIGGVIYVIIITGVIIGALKFVLDIVTSM